MAKIAVIDARKDLADILNRAAYGKERVVLTRRGKDVAAIVPMLYWKRSRTTWT